VKHLDAINGYGYFHKKERSMSMYPMPANNLCHPNIGMADCVLYDENQACSEVERRKATMPSMIHSVQSEMDFVAKPRIIVRSETQLSFRTKQSGSGSRSI
jgi:hypothetical protein